MHCPCGQILTSEVETKTKLCWICQGAKASVEGEFHGIENWGPWFEQDTQRPAR